MYVINGLSMMKLELKKSENPMRDLFCSCFLPKSQRWKYLNNQLTLFEDLKHLLPGDLSVYEMAEKES
jgi:hypothetical protein